MKVIRIATILVLLFAVVMSVLVAVPYPPITNPFAGYEELALGRVASLRDCVATYIPFEVTPDSISYCRLGGSTYIDSVGVVLRNGMVDRITFYTEGVEYGHLVALWGRADKVSETRRGYTACWTRGSVVTGNIYGHLTLRSPVYFVALTESVQNCFNQYLKNS